jgi:mono/diheme cytochrome c family protein
MRCRDEEEVLRAKVLGELGLLAVVLAGCMTPAPSVSEGRSLYEANGCASCHGRDGHGNGPLTEKVPSKPIDLHDASLFKRGASEGAIANTLAEGIKIDHSIPELHQTHHELLMPKYDHLTEIERRSIALYVLSLSADTDQRRLQP